MKREQQLTVDFKVKEYNSLKLKQYDSTVLKIKTVDEGLEISLEGLSANLIFEKPDSTVVYQDCEINENIIIANLLADCLRQSGKGNIEVQIRQNEDILSTFQIPVVIEKSAKDNIESSNTPNYVEILEDAIVEEQKRQQNEEIRQKNEATREENEIQRKNSEEERNNNENTRLEAENQRQENENVREQNEETRNTNEDTRTNAELERIQAENDRKASYEEMKNYFDNNAIATNKYTMIINTDYEAGANIIIPCYYKVGNNVLDVFYNGERLLLSSDEQGTNGHYCEVGEANSISNVIKTTIDWKCKTNDYFEFIIRGEYTV